MTTVYPARPSTGAISVTLARINATAEDEAWQNSDAPVRRKGEADSVFRARQAEYCKRNHRCPQCLSSVHREERSAFNGVFRYVAWACNNAQNCDFTCPASS